MERETIDKEYADLCLKYGDISQKIIHLEDQEQKVIEEWNDKLKKIEESYIQARFPLRKELRQIETRWLELKELLNETPS